MGLDGVEGKSLKTRNEAPFLLRRAKRKVLVFPDPLARRRKPSQRGGAPRGGGIRASEAPPAILGPSGAARRLPEPKNLIFLKLALLISGLLLGPPWASPALP